MSHYCLLKSDVQIPIKYRYAYFLKTASRTQETEKMQSIDGFPCTSYKNVNNIRVHVGWQKIERAYGDSAKVIFDSIQAKSDIH